MAVCLVIHSCFPVGRKKEDGKLRSGRSGKQGKRRRRRYGKRRTGRRRSGRRRKGRRKRGGVTPAARKIRGTGQVQVPKEERQRSKSQIRGEPRKGRTERRCPRRLRSPLPSQGRQARSAVEARRSVPHRPLPHRPYPQRMKLTVGLYEDSGWWEVEERMLRAMSAAKRRA